ncbi:hypothetical protein Tco_0998369, partial [Tanacetum coccineum]
VKLEDLLSMLETFHSAVVFLGAVNQNVVQPLIAVETWKNSFFYCERAVGMYSSLPYALAQYIPKWSRWYLLGNPCQLDYGFLTSQVQENLVFELPRDGNVTIKGFIKEEFGFDYDFHYQLWLKLITLLHDKLLFVTDSDREHLIAKLQETEDYVVCMLIKSSAHEASTAAAAPKCCLSNVLVLKEVSHYCLGTRMICAASVYFMLLMQDLMLPIVISYVNAAIDTTAIGFKRRS